MTTYQYEQIIEALATVSRLTRFNDPDQTPTDLRIRSLLSITLKEVRRALTERGLQQRMQRGHEDANIELQPSAVAAEASRSQPIG